MYIKFRIIWKKRSASEIIFFLNYTLQKAGLLKVTKGPVSEYLWADNILKAPKHCLNLHPSIFVISFDHSEKKSAPNILS